ncbi:MAG: putative transport system permease protein [Thermoanaerobaculia bacterium]|jgi:putative ABC transport system permease protein|nr:putative transport system permease protein [Thermoanaerobaculia bacterium]
MRLNDTLRLTLGALRSQGLRTLLAALAIAVGIASVILLTSIGQGVREYVTGEFSQFGTNLLIVSPGRVTTTGMSIGIFGTVRPLTIEDAEAVRRAPYVQATNATTDGNAEVTVHGKRRRITVYAMTADWPRVAHMSIRTGSFLPREELYAPRPLAVLGSRAKQELFGDANPLGERITIGGSRYRIIGVMESKGQFLGMDLDDTIYIPVARGLELFNRPGLTGFHVTYDPAVPAERVVEGVRRVIQARHGRDDITVITQQKMLDVMSSVLGVLTFAVGALGSISLLVGGVGILTIMTIAVSERTSEIGLLVALGATRRQIQTLFLGEAALLAALGGTAGLALGAGLARLLALIVPALPVSTPWWFAALAEGIAIIVGLAAGVFPAHRAARMEPVDALRAE